MRKKYYKVYKYIAGKLYDSNDKLVTKKELYNIINKYKVPSHLHDVTLVANNISEADNGIIYIGLDSKNKKQYIYGINFIKRRKAYKINIFLNVEKKIPSIEKFIKHELHNLEYNKPITETNLFAIILVMEMNFFIRTGKKKYLNDNETIGLMTLQKKNFKVCDDNIIITFKGKLGQLQEFSIDKSGHKLLYNIIKILYENTNDFIFKDSNGNIFTESKLYSMMKKYKITLKDIRTYGVNKILIRELWKEIQSMNEDDILDLRKKHIKKLMSNIINRTASIIGHTPAISKKSYIVDELRNLIDISVISKSKELNFDKFYNYILNKLKNEVNKIDN
ncbi:DNA topoisomerase type I [Alphaentomopoxvirus acuprea]|uniref:DNA topoisomerase n=1 Tax=Alphaentomopoxvirus acuprea TaxID=62099 RepID=W6JIX1_9POXV|nr:DNA topoisomerase type I [Anomala cuprea entomopoxvirus]BAO49512.1 DNA topoisomerase type I [Anomala cuprea entomopoxvirus]